MTVVLGCTGHQGLTPQTERLVTLRLVEVLNNLPEKITGISSLAEGADQLFSFAVLAVGGQIDAVIPCEQYGDAFPTPDSGKKYMALKQLSRSETTLPFGGPSEDAFVAAGRRVAETADELIAVWDGKDAVGKGGTGDIVEYARSLGKKVHVIWPTGSSRSRT